MNWKWSVRTNNGIIVKWMNGVLWPSATWWIVSLVPRRYLEDVHPVYILWFRQGTKLAEHKTIKSPMSKFTKLLINIKSFHSKNTTSIGISLYLISISFIFSFYYKNVIFNTNLNIQKQVDKIYVYAQYKQHNQMRHKNTKRYTASNLFLSM